VDVEEMNKEVQAYFKDSFSINKKMNNEVTSRLKDAVADLKAKMGPIMELGNPAMRPRHWEKLFKIMNQAWYVCRLIEVQRHTHAQTSQTLGHVELLTCGVMCVCGVRLWIKVPGVEVLPERADRIRHPPLPGRHQRSQSNTMSP
jgi:hypothetical protein